MPKRMLNGERIWNSSKLASLPDEMALAYCYLYPIALADGTFEAEPSQVRALVFGRRKSWPVKKVAALLDEFERIGLLQRRRDVDGVVWGFWTGSDSELPKKSELFKLKVGKRFLFETQEELLSTSGAPQERIASGFGLVRLGKVREGLEDLPCEPSTITSKQEQTKTMKLPEILFEDLAKLYVSLVPEGICKRPWKGWWKGFEDALKELGGNSDLLTRAFELWIAENGDSRDHTPLIEFLKVRYSFLDRVRKGETSKRKVITGDEPEVKANLDAQIQKYRDEHNARMKPDEMGIEETQRLLDETLREMGL